MLILHPNQASTEHSSSVRLTWNPKIFCRKATLFSVINIYAAIYDAIAFCYPVSIKFPFITIKLDLKPFGWFKPRQIINSFTFVHQSVGRKQMYWNEHSPSNEQSHHFRIESSRVESTESIVWIVCVFFSLLNCKWFNGNICGSFHFIDNLPLTLEITSKHNKIWINNAICHHSNQFCSREHECEQFGRLNFKPWIDLHVIIFTFGEKLGSA